MRRGIERNEIEKKKEELERGMKKEMKEVRKEGGTKRNEREARMKTKKA